MVMQVFDNNSLDLNQWNFGDVIRYGAEYEDESNYAKVVSFNCDGIKRYSTMLISEEKEFDGSLSTNGKLNNGFRGLPPKQQQKSIKEFEEMLKGLKAIAKNDN